ncbi:MAG TPA: hypothetical protein VII73_13045 [Caulobacteraceae bacterium]
MKNRATQPPKAGGERGEKHQGQAGERRLGLTHPDDNMRIPEREGQPPRPATEPRGATSSAHNSETQTDPATGEPNRDRH